MSRLLSLGTTGSDVQDLQRSLNERPPTLLPLLRVDGIFGSKTKVRVQEFQGQNQLKVDGIAGPLTHALLSARRPIPARLVFCGDSLATNALGTPTTAAPSRTTRAITLPKLPKLPSLPKLRSLTPPEITTATAVFGRSIDFSIVFISDKTGQGDRPFVLAVPSPLGPQQIMNMGTFFTTEDLLHELTHVWQSQHHSDPFAYMSNCVGSQKLAELLGGGHSAYAYVPGKPFGEYAGEQIAQQVQRGEAPIIAHVSGVAPHRVDAENVNSLKAFRFEDTTKAGVKI